MSVKRNISKPTRFVHDKKISTDNFNVAVASTGDAKLQNLKDIALSDDNANALITSSFLFGAEEGLQNSQQLKVDFSEFRNHIFFNSAIVATNVALDNVLNHYPFDGTYADVIKFLEGLTGYERYIFDNFPTSVGILPFTGGLSQSISVSDYAHSKKINNREYGSGLGILNPKEKSFTIESHIFVPKIANANQYIVQKMSSSNRGISLVLSQSDSTVTGTIYFAVSSGSSELFTTASVDKGRFNHIVATLNREDEVHKAEIYVDNALQNSTSSVNIGEIDFNTSQLFIGSGSSHTINSLSYGPTATFSGALDELRIWHTTRSIDQQKRFSKRAIFAQDNLKLYFRFNEPQNTPKPSLVLDYSGNGLHGTINANVGFSTIVNGNPMSASLRATSSFTVPMTLENSLFSPILFPNQTTVNTFKDALLHTATLYDRQNPNLITNLIPQHYFEEGASFEFQASDDNTIYGEIDTFDTKLQTAQILSSFLYTIAKSLDEMKIFIDQFQNILTVNFDDFNTTPDILIPKVAEFFGLKFSSFFENATFRQFFFNEDVIITDELLSLTLFEVRDSMWKRIFANLPDILKSKGTMHSIKSFIRSLGINPDNNFRIKEFGGDNTHVIEDIHIVRSETSTMLNMSSSNSTKGYIRSPFLTSSAMTIGNYNQSGRAQSDKLRTGKYQGLLTSQSFTIEHIVMIPQSTATSATQSLSRLAVTGTNAGGFSDFAMNVVALTSSIAESSSIKLFVKPITTEIGEGQDRAVLTLSGANVFDTKKWNIAYGKQIISEQSSSYFIYAAKNEEGEVNTIYSQSINLLNTGSTGINVFNTFVSNINASGAFIVCGNTGSSGPTLLLSSGTSLGNDYASATVSTFDGKIGHIKYWTKALDVDEFKEHVYNFKSIGTENPNTQISFNTSSDERLIIDATTDQDNKETDANGALTLLDFTQNQMHFTGTAFNTSDVLIHNEDFHYAILSPFFDENQNVDKVRIRSFKDKENVIFYNTPAAPVTEILLHNDDVSVDPRFSVDFSIIDALDEDIIKIMSTLDSFNNDIGNVENMYAFEYQNLENLRYYYFNRLTDKINLRSFFDFFVWFDRNIGDFIKRLVPERAKFSGTHFIIESHILERPKFNYHSFSIYLNEEDRNSIMNSGAQRNEDGGNF